MATAAAAKKTLSASDVTWAWDDESAKKTWELFARFGAGNAGANEISGKNFDKWLKDGGILDAKTFTTTMTGIAFSKISGAKRKTLNFKESKEVLVRLVEDRANKTKKSVQEELDAVVEKLSKLEGPSMGNVTKAVHQNVVDRLTDTSKYTGSHKERFDESGKGRGKAGRQDVVDNSGYVAAFKKHDEK